jgi:hypothetical protein
MQKFLFSVLWSVIFLIPGFAQDPDPLDFGKMWTFENPPQQYLKETYDMNVDDEWFDYVRKSSLRFASWCSASFISDQGLIMTNHHCSRDVVTGLQRKGENFDKQGFYAASLKDERKAEGLFVEQLIMAEDITDWVKVKTQNAQNEEEELKIRREALSELEKMYKEKPEWKDLRIQIVTFYSGGKFSIYGYKRYDDIRLVWIPELDLGFFGGDPDNFTYPRYNLDATFWRAYENGKPVNTSANYLKFNKNGAAEGEPVFIVGNPGRTERYRTVSQLEFDRDYRYPFMFKFTKNRNDYLMKKYNSIKDNPEKEYEAQELLNTIANIANGMKAFGGITGGLRDPELFGRKESMESFIRSKSPGVTYWDEMEAMYKKLNPHGWAIVHLQPNRNRGNIYGIMHDILQYRKMMDDASADSDKKEKLKSTILAKSKTLLSQEQTDLFKMWLTEVSEDIYPGDMTLQKVLGSENIDTYVKDFLNNTLFTNEALVTKFLDGEVKDMENKDPLLTAAEIFVSRYNEAGAAFQSTAPARQALEAKIANQAFQVFGDKLPPDATFTLRITDGVVKGYSYNGTEAPANTTYFGLYDRFYSHDKEFPWSLPERWQKPSVELLKSPFNFVSTNDIIGGNSGSPVINRNREAVGLVFDGNIESLPGNFIYDSALNRSVSVHAGGIYAALKHIYKANRIVKELDK